MKINLLFTGLFLSFGLVGCNILPPLPNINTNESSNKVSSNPVLEEMCYTAKKNKARANKLYKGKIVSATGKLSISEAANYIGYTGHIRIKTKDFYISLGLNKKFNLELYDNDQIVNSGNVKVLGVSVTSPISSYKEFNKWNCFITVED